MQANCRALSAACLLTALPAAAASGPDSLWVVAHVKARTVAVSPDEPHEPWRLLPDQVPAGALSPDGARVAFLGSPNDEGFALFVADVTDETPHRKKNIRQVTPVMPGMVHARWTHDGSHIVLGTLDPAKTAIFIVDPRTGAADAAPRRLSAGGEPARDPRPGPDGRVAYRTVDQSAKPYAGDVVVVNPDGTGRRVLLEDVGVRSLEWSPDGRHLACSVDGSLLIIDAADGSTRALRYAEIDERLYAHHAPAVAWRPDGKLIALSLNFSGGTMLDPSAPPPPPPFWAGKLFLAPIGEGNLDPAAVTWIEAPANIVHITWTTAARAQRDGEPMDKKE